MRDIKFRAFNKKESKMCRVISTDFKEIVTVVFPEFDNENFDDSFFDTMELIEFEGLLQYTGLKDKNGKEIYEGDLLYHEIEGLKKVYYPFNETSASFGIVEVSNGMSSYLKNSFFYEVIGNVYENPELLKGE